MPTFQVTNLNGEVMHIEGSEGDTLMEALKNGGCDDIEAICGGACSCSSCHVYLLDGWYEALGGRNAMEEELVSESEHFRNNSRLSCQVTLSAEMNNLSLAIAPAEG